MATVAPTTIDIDTNAFNFTYHGSELANNGQDVLHNVDSIFEVNFKGVPFTVLYQCGMSFTNNDYDRPSTKLGISDSSIDKSNTTDMFKSTDTFILKMNQLTEDTIEKFSEEDVVELDILAEANAEIETVDDLLMIHHALNELTFEINLQFELFKEDKALSDDPYMWVNEELEPYLRLIESGDAQDLNHLTKILNGLDAIAKAGDLSKDAFYDACDLPSFGTEPVKLDDDIFSWDDSSVLRLGTTLENKGWYTETRSDLA
jgi:hypothetical protein